MIIEAAGSPNDENELEAYRFNLVPTSGGFILRLVRFVTYTRETECDEWQEKGKFTFPDLENKSTLPSPEVPPWAISEAKTNLLQHISFHPL